MSAFKGYNDFGGDPKPDGIVLPGWWCPWCKGFNGEEKERLTHCRACGVQGPLRSQPAGVTTFETQERPEDLVLRQLHAALATLDTLSAAPFDPRDWTTVRDIVHLAARAAARRLAPSP